MEEVSFKERVRQTAIEGAKAYKKNFIDIEYLLCSKAFHDKGYYIAKADKGNYLHLIGVHTELSAEIFFNKCYDGSLVEDDFDFKKKNQPEKSVKGSVRQKIKALPNMLKMYDRELIAQEDFKKNHVECAFATAEDTHTLGYTGSGRPMSLLQKNELDEDKAQKVDLILKKQRGMDRFTELICGDENLVMEYMEQIVTLIDAKSIWLYFDEKG